MTKTKKQRIWFGKHKGSFISELPIGYCHWLWDNVDLHDRGIFDAVAERLGKTVDDLFEEAENFFNDVPEPEPEPPKAAPEAELIKTMKERLRSIYRRLSFICHPDRGGDNEVMKLVNELKELL